MLRPAINRFEMLRLYMRTQRNRIDFGRTKRRIGRQIGTVETFGRMRIHGPSADRHGIGEVALHQVLLRQHMIAQQSAAAAFAGHHADPIHRPVAAVGEIAAVLDVVPDAHHDGEQFEPDAFVVVDDVLVAAPFDPPIAVFPGVDLAMINCCLVILRAHDGGGERHGLVIQPRSEQDAGAERVGCRARSGASGSSYSLRASRPLRISAPASRPSRESPVQSQNILARMR